MMNDEHLAQLWHDDHCDGGEYRAVSSCWCCCEDCDPDWGGTNPYFAVAMREMSQPMRELPSDFFR